MTQLPTLLRIKLVNHKFYSLQETNLKSYLKEYMEQFESSQYSLKGKNRGGSEGFYEWVEVDHNQSFSAS